MLSVPSSKYNMNETQRDAPCELDPALYARIGSALFGRRLKLYVAHWIRSRGNVQFFQMQLVHACGHHGTNALKPLAQLISLGMVEELPQYVGGGRRKNYVQRAHKLWEVVDTAVACAGGSSSAEPPRSLLSPGVSEETPTAIPLVEGADD
jgi:hypothetical protein